MDIRAHFTFTRWGSLARMLSVRALIPVAISQALACSAKSTEDQTSQVHQVASVAATVDSSATSCTAFVDDFTGTSLGPNWFVAFGAFS
jgi:hypothetical protein